MTPEEVICVAFRAASRGIAQDFTPKTASAFEVFLVQAHDSVKQTAKALTLVAKERPNATNGAQIEMLEMHAFNQTLQAAVTCLMMLGHFPYLKNIDSSVVKDKLDG